MGIAFSMIRRRRRRRRNNDPSYNSSPSQLLYISPDTSYLSAPPPSSGYPPPPLPPNFFSFPPQNSYPAPSPPSRSPYYQSAGGYNDSGYANHVDDSTTVRTSSQPSQTPHPSVGHLNAKKVKNDINVRKDTIKLEVDEMDPDCHLVSFTFDAMVDGSITVYYFAKEGADCSFSQLYSDTYMPVRMPFQKGLGQKFRQIPATGIDLGFFELDDLSKPSAGEDVFPLVIVAEASLPPQPDDQLDQSLQPTRSSNAQITQAILETNNGDPFQVRVVKQILWVDGVRYELREIYGIGNSVEAGFGDNDEGKECVICMTEPKDTAVLPCRHLCMCRECANELKHQSNKCPICRQAIEELLEI
ncbi:probable E3 ubiquitin-protein ligase LUL4 [Macadamia integrifolia]|uniref:probable E3 ubiquitin-protein ligase LUL4 n=1 Tax=Macadamia integrifolia TaxID=60698 RepID=UPI001C4F1D28|nr:probable E3 ubiquitin-protein ligase LUL4 [Macadamia integrifolia]